MRVESNVGAMLTMCRWNGGEGKGYVVSKRRGFEVVRYGEMEVDL